MPNCNSSRTCHLRIERRRCPWPRLQNANTHRAAWSGVQSQSHRLSSGAWTWFKSQSDCAVTWKNDSSRSSEKALFPSLSSLPRFDERRGWPRRHDISGPIYRRRYQQGSQTLDAVSQRHPSSRRSCTLRHVPRPSRPLGITEATMQRKVLGALGLGIVAAITSNALRTDAQARPPRVPWHCRPAGACKCHEMCTYDGRTTTCRFICQPTSVTERSARPAAGNRRPPVTRSPIVRSMTRAPESLRHKR